MARTTPQSAAERETVLTMKDQLSETGFDQVQSHTTLRQLVPANLKPRYYFIVNRAMTLLNSESGFVFEVVKGVGYRRLSGEVGVPRTGINGLLKIRRTSRRYRKRLINAVRHTNDLSSEARRTASICEAKFGLIEYLTMARTAIHVPTDDEPLNRHSDPLAPLRVALGL